jgi:prephenate dehydratase
MARPPERRPGRGRAGYLGPAGTFSEEALLASADEELVEPVPVASIYETLMALRRGELEWAIVPIENSLEGSINVTLDLLAGEASDLRIVGEAILRIRHALIAAGPRTLEEIETVLSHPAVPGQCTRFLRGELPWAEIVPAGSTAEAVRTVAGEGGRSRAALGTELAAEIYGATVLRRGVEDRDDNQTRFVWLARAEPAGVPPTPPPLRAGDGGAWKCSIVFWGSGAEHSGWLVRCLGELAERGINLTRIESRPRRTEMGSYIFFADMAGHQDEPVVAEALAAIAELCEHVAVLGSYRAAAAPATEAAGPGGGGDR